MLYLKPPKKILLIEDKSRFSYSFVSVSYTNYGSSVYYDEISKTVKEAGSYCDPGITKKYPDGINPLKKIFESLDLVEVGYNEEIINRHKLL